eukprot:CAMPEP_0204355106 /NCGR_PEP_ID=MMETSP0469-20131031/33893_1 /ASSEMBLY_ACC=CAM_ASM_000384 /TAXON_ID=2969 /ORGANISM="Oxyrrhis marina" /LENGTH=107 /DNA_ID=CAMNT_0051342297 /DNA_START=79 /DNA_END=399 /DNA_ORIENTATION=+
MLVRWHARAAAVVLLAAGAAPPQEVDTSDLTVHIASLFGGDVKTGPPAAPVADRDTPKPPTVRDQVALAQAGVELPAVSSASPSDNVPQEQVDQLSDQLTSLFAHSP